ncbi:YeeE/YedE family protein [Photobacterium sanctipauli]|uniref:YeeE/YedE family protein n=1 Tax=Photobacterium sanctipauli TaxID=1342794 RepID=A0A2T3N983_9GAMM|nr:YeeE/YedE family protein [Photobacterium sanctipauli]PSW09987.1 YeeE/YedE family protein [Photobacterium sanctipauli]
MTATRQLYMGAALLVSILLVGALLLGEGIYLRLILGLALGIALTKGAIGFAGSINRAYRRGSTQLLQTLMILFVVTAVINAGLLYGAEAGTYNLWVNPINIGLIVGGLMFGFGMTLSSCCASGVMVEMVSDVPRALTTLVAFGFGVFIGFPIQSSSPLVTETLFSTASYEGQGVFLPDLFAWGPLNGYLMSILVTIGFAVLTIKLAKKYEQKRKQDGTYLGVDAEANREAKALANQAPSRFAWLSGLWTMNTAALVIAITFGVMMATTANGWGASSPFGFWFGKLLLTFGIELETITSFTGRPEQVFTTPFFEHGVSVQNAGILLGTLVAVLWIGKFSSPCKTNYSFKQYMLFALGGVLMGLGTRFANGCNVGALYTPIANFSLSGWIFFATIIAGGILGNQFARKVSLIPVAPKPQLASVGR